MSHSDKVDVCMKCKRTREEHIGSTECNFPIFIAMAVVGTVANTDRKSARRRYFHTGMEIGALVEEKNAAYGNSVAKSGEFLKLLYPNGIKPEQYGDALLLARIFDKQMRIATKKDALGENPYRDIAGYGILGATEETAK